MNQIDFLPKSFHDQRVQSGRLYLQIGLLAVMAVGVIGWLFIARAKVRDLEAQARDVKAQVASVRQQSGDIKTKRMQLADLQMVVHVQEELRRPLANTQVLAVISQMMPETTTLTELSVVGRRPKVTPKVKAGAPAPNQAQPEKADVLQIRLTGLSLQDADVATFFSRLSTHPLFTNVNMLSNRSTEIVKVVAREFQIEMEVPMDRDYQPVRPASSPALSTEAPGRVSADAGKLTVQGRPR